MTTERDDNEDALRRMSANGDDLNRPRDVNFSVVFPTENAAEQFAEHFRGLGYTVTVELSECVDELPWDATVVKHMAPSSDEISEFEIVLEEAATPLSGRNDGWGCFSEPR